MSAEGFRARARPEPPSAQILVVVANTLERSWRTDAEKGFLSTAVAQVLVDPKPRAKALQRGPHDRDDRLPKRGPDPVRGARAPSGRGPSEVSRVPGSALLPTPLRRGNPAKRRDTPERSFSRRRGGPGADARRAIGPLNTGPTAPARPDPRWAWDNTGERAGYHATSAKRRSPARLALLGRVLLKTGRSRGGPTQRSAVNTTLTFERSDMAKGNPVKIPGPGE